MSIYPGYNGSARPMGSNRSPGWVFAKDFPYFTGRAVDKHNGKERETPNIWGHGFDQRVPSSPGGPRAAPASKPSKSSKEGEL